ncbi:glycosyl hydrolase [Noviherbaspirillum sedimenti]|uniref:Glycosyl hydrolase n=2 Tax=Noviherbaspirillum sedimenti TaxID=2320865 RepID=A0A3A3G7J1_9BURK|nr:glycosyl hydrolase [Noviherbaspirillum sedimenti]
MAAKLAALALALPLAASAATFQDVLDTPAKESALAARSLLNGVVGAGKRVVAVGQRGHIVYSDDQGKSWRQASVPVSSDLLAVTFSSPQKGWAVGHDGVVLHTADGGANWVKQLDGSSAAKVLESFYAKQAATGELGSSEQSAALVEEVARLARQGAETPFLDVWFADDNTGFIVGAFNLIFRTGDGGKTWEPWFHRTENPTRMHLYAIRQVGGALYISGEQGLVLKLDEAGKRFAAMDTGYRGTYFGVNGNKDAVVVFGLRGNAYRSIDGGRQWAKIETGLQDGITGATTCGANRLVLISQSGRMLASDDAGERFRPVKLAQPGPASAIACVSGDVVVIAGPRGVHAHAFDIK